MTRTTTSRPRMAATYAPGTVRARRWHGEGDVRGYRPPRGWTARADLTDFTPSRAAPCRVPCGGSSKPRNNPSARRPRPFRPGAGGQNPGAAVAAPGFKPKARTPLRRLRAAAKGRAQGLVRETRSPRRHPPPVFDAPRRNGRGCGATPRLAAAGCTKACRPRRWRFVACTSRRTVHRHAARPCNGASTPRLKHGPQAAAGALGLVVGH
jgi:hypothetical protein